MEGMKMSNNNKYVFISYSTKNQEEANAIRYYLEKNGINTWMAPYDIPPGNTYAKVINQAIQQCSCCVLVLSNESQQSMWVPREIERAINYHKILIPISIETVILNDEFELYISTNQIVNVGKINDNSTELQKILAVIKETVGKTIVSQSDSNTKEENQSGLFDTMFFGSYYYGNQGETAPIEWIILKEENGRKLLLSKYIIDAVDYHEKGQVQSWEECSIRTWLNTEFIKKSFSETEAACLIETRRDETRNLFYQTEDLKQCEDKVFLLSVEEIEKYLGTDKVAMGPVTPYALERGVFTQNAGLWWTCTPGDDFGMQTYIDTEGGIAYEGCYQQRSEVGLRPAMWINEEA